MHVVYKKDKSFCDVLFWERCLFGISTCFNNQNQTKMFEFDVLAESLLDFSFRGLQL